MANSDLGCTSQQNNQISGDISSVANPEFLQDEHRRDAKQGRDITLKRIFIITNFVVEIPSAVFDQLSSVQKPQYALISMIMSFATVLISVIDLAHMGGRQGAKWMWRDSIPWFYAPFPNHQPLGSFSDIVGLVCGIFQCVFATISFAFLSQNADNPIKISIWPLIFAFGVLCSRFPRTNQRNISALECVEIHPNSPSEGTLHGQQPLETPLLLDNRERERVLAEIAEQQPTETPLLLDNKERERELAEIAEQVRKSAEISNREIFNKWQAQRWWAENYDKVIEPYNFGRLNQVVPLPTAPWSEDESSKPSSSRDADHSGEFSVNDASDMGTEWTGEYQPGVYITIRELPGGIRELNRVRFSPKMFNKWQAQRWWAENYDMVMELFNVGRLNQQAVPPPFPPWSEDECSKPSSSKDADHPGKLSVNDPSDMGSEWVEEDEPGVYITIRELPGGTRELRRVRFSRKRFGETHARLWWEENRARIHKQYL